MGCTGLLKPSKWQINLRTSDTYPFWVTYAGSRAYPKSAVILTVIKLYILIYIYFKTRLQSLSWGVCNGLCKHQISPLWCSKLVFRGIKLLGTSLGNTCALIVPKAGNASTPKLLHISSGIEACRWCFLVWTVKLATNYDKLRDDVNSLFWLQGKVKRWTYARPNVRYFELRRTSNFELRRTSTFGVLRTSKVERGRNSNFEVPASSLAIGRWSGVHANEPSS